MDPKLGCLLLTGSKGFTGKHFVPVATALGFNVVCLKSDIRDLAELQQEIATIDVEYVLHLAGISDTQCKNVQLLRDVNVKGTHNLLQALVATGKKPRRVIVTSSVLVYGASPVSPVTENHELSPFNPYAQSKIEMEAVVKQFAQHMPVCIARSFNYSGVGQDTRFLIPKLVDHFANKKTTIELGNVNFRREFNDVRSVCNVLARLLVAAHCKPVYNICSGHSHTVKDVLAMLHQITGHKIRVVINENLVRSVDISELRGSPDLLERTLGPHLFEKDMKSMLAWMVDSVKKNQH